MEDWLDALTAEESDGERMRWALLSAAEGVSQSGAWAWRPEDGRTIWSAAMLRLWGVEPGSSLANRTSVVRPTLQAESEIEILRLASEGFSGPAIAQRLFVSPTTVKTHFESIYDKYGVPDRVAAVAKAMREGLLS